jgi:[ribosomal protein S5]-alanine N-acetyltransferase
MLDLSAVFAHFPILETSRYLLRALTLEDTIDIFHIMRDPSVTRYLAQHPMNSLEDAARRVQMFRTAFQSRTAVPWAIYSPAEEKVIGTCNFWNLNLPHYRAEIGYTLGSEWWGQGVMTEVVSATLTFGFTTMGLYSIEAQIDPENTRSRRLLEKLGFVQEGYFRENYYDEVKAEFTDTAVFSLLGKHWMGRNNG